MLSDRLAQMECFVRAAEAGSFSAAAAGLGVGQPQVSKAIAALEARLGARLFNRTTRRLALTEEGERYLETARSALDAAAAADASVAGSAEPSGVLRLAAPVGFAVAQILPRLPAFAERFPKIEIDLRLADQFVDLIAEGVDLAIRLGDLSDSSLAARRIGAARRVCVASPAYLARRGAPARPEDLAEHDCIAYTRLQTDDWVFAAPEGPVRIRPKGRLRTDSSVAVREAVIAGMGVGCNPLWLYSEDLRAGRVVEILEAFSAPALPIHLVTPARRLAPPRVVAMSDFLADAFRADPFLR